MLHEEGRKVREESKLIFECRPSAVRKVELIAEEGGAIVETQATLEELQAEARWAARGNFPAQSEAGRWGQQTTIDPETPPSFGRCECTDSFTCLLGTREKTT